MATLTRPKVEKLTTQTPAILSSAVPAPFPRAQYEQAREGTRSLLGEGQAQDSLAEPIAGPSRIVTSDVVTQDEMSSRDILPSIISVQKSSVMALNSLLSAPTNWSPIIPGRRHSLGSIPRISPESEPSTISSSSALQTLVANLRNRDTTEDMIEYRPATNDDELVHELRTRVERISPSLDSDDAQLATSLVSLLAHLNRLSKLQKSSGTSEDPLVDVTSHEAAAPSELFNVLRQQLSDLQTERVSLKRELAGPETPPVLAVESALLWHKVDEDLETVVNLCRERSEIIHRQLPDYLPPEYEKGEYEHDALPEYDYSDGRMSIDSSKSRISLLSSTTHIADEKMKMDLENVSMAIERLYMVAPQLHNQRAELKIPKRQQVGQTSRDGSETPKQRNGKQKERDMDDDLDEILSLIGKASDRKLHNQVVTLDHTHTVKLEKARQKDLAQRDQFVENLARHAQAGRLHGQDATFQQPRTRDPEAMLSLPEFIREPLPQHMRSHPTAMLTLPELLSESPPERRAERPISGPAEQMPTKKLRNRSSSAPSLSWLFAASGRMSPHYRSRSRNIVEPMPPLPTNAFDVHHIAENHENLHHVIVFFTVTGSPPGIDLEAEVISPEGLDNYLVISGGQEARHLPLPAAVQSGLQVVKAQGDHYEVKMQTLRSSDSQGTQPDDQTTLLDATELASANPSTFICSSCSLPIVQSSAIKQYRDLPSEHWAELVDAWMCHTDQKLHDQIVKNSKAGFWPNPGEALVGGSYILFEHSSVAVNNIHAEDVKSGEDWQLVRCLCGAVLGRCQQDPIRQELAYRLLKYAIRLVSQSSPSPKIPLSAFVARDMIELAQAHASYRFVIVDEEEEIHRMLIWLFKPSIRISYTTSLPYTIPKSGSINAAKVLYKVLTPAERNTDIKDILNKYPGFPQAEYLFYPMPICRQLGNLLRESNATYPRGMREMMNLKLGWLSRA